MKKLLHLPRRRFSLFLAFLVLGQLLSSLCLEAISRSLQKGFPSLGLADVGVCCGPSRRRRVSSRPSPCSPCYCYNTNMLLCVCTFINI